MDKHIAAYPCRHDADLAIVDERGIAYQREMSAGRVPYAEAYWAKVSAYEDSEIASSVNRGRCQMIASNLLAPCSVIDIGAGTGAFVRAARDCGFFAKGYDPMPRAEAALRADGLWARDVNRFDVVTMWDSLEHMDDPGEVLSQARMGAWLFVSLPIFRDLSMIRQSKHYRPGEHLYYFTAEGLLVWLGLYGFLCCDISAHEIQAGREDIGAFAFRRVLQ